VKRQYISQKPWLMATGIVCLIFLSLVGWWGYSIYADSQKTYPLGDGLEYIGKVDYGCWLICDSSPSSVYYYATDMSSSEIVRYFDKATVVQNNSPDSFHAYTSLWLRYNGESFDIYHYENKNDVSRKLKLRDSTKAHVINIEESAYDLAKKSLQ